MRYSMLHISLFTHILQFMNNIVRMCKYIPETSKTGNAQQTQGLRFRFQHPHHVMHQAGLSGHGFAGEFPQQMGYDTFSYKD